MSDLEEAEAKLTHALARARTEEHAERQPVHTVYGGAHLFRADTAPRLGARALEALDRYAPDPATLATALEADAPAEAVWERVRAKLLREPVEDFRIDFEDGYGVRPDSEEDEHAETAARELARGMAEGTLPPFIGIRAKALTMETRARAVRTLRRFADTLLRSTGGVLPPGFVITLPKVTVPEQAELLALLLERLEAEHGVAAGTLRMELMVETPEALFDHEGRAALPGLVRAGRGRVVAAHFGAYDYTAALGITAAHQHLRHPACDWARHAMQVSLAGSGVRWSDGATTLLPVAPRRGELSAEQEAENRAAVHRGWRVHHDDVRHGLASGFYQGWDLHPAQLVSRYAAVYGFFLEGVDAAGERLRNFVDRAARATRVGSAFDDAATGQGLLNFFLRALGCGAISEEDALARTGLTSAELRMRSFASIVRAREDRTENGK
ncbi:MAG TPA: aldolase/citrate lyase family protein [Longimicrobium sp.]|jgi:citrate lyase beta subunit